MRSFAALVLGCLLLTAGPAARACINDREVNSAEREFKSSYMEDTPQGEPAPEYAPPPPDRTAPLAVLGLGSTLLLGAAVVCLKRPGGQR